MENKIKKRSSLLKTRENAARDRAWLEEPFAGITKVMITHIQNSVFNCGNRDN